MPRRPLSGDQENSREYTERALLNRLLLPISESVIMAVSVVEDLYKVLNHRLARVVLQGDNREELTRMDARNAALDYASERNFRVSGISSIRAPFPVNSNGELTEKLMSGQEKIAAWRLEVDIVGS